MNVDDLPLSRASADRATDLRAEPGVLARALTDPRTRVLLVRDGAVVTVDQGPSDADPRGGSAGTRVATGTANRDGWGARRTGTAARIAYLDPRTAASVVAAGGEPAPDEDWILLGRAPRGDDVGARVAGAGASEPTDERPAPLVVALRVPRDEPVPQTGQPVDLLVHRQANPAASGPLPALPPGLSWSSLRGVGADLDAYDTGLATTAVALDSWHAHHVRCPLCGAPTRVAQAGWTRICTVDGSEHFPRIDPAVIMTVVDDDDRLLLGHNVAWAPGRYSMLAGFVEAGESAEHAVRREVREETSIEVDRVEYRGSQPWPFPASLMLGYCAHAATTQVRVDGYEVTDARWFTRAGLAAAVHAGEVVLPGPASIAYALVEDWYGTPLPVRS